MRVVLSGGGTGGHIYPAVAIVRQCEEDEPGSKFLYIGGTRGLESRLIPQEKIPFKSLDITGFRRAISMDNLKTMIRFVKGVQTSKRFLIDFKPDVVVGTGGYVCGPVVYAAAKLGIPSIIHEQNAIPGLTNSFLSRYVNTVAVSFPNVEASFPRAKHVIYTGNPRATTVRHANRNRGFATLGIPMESSVVLVVGGSRGAKAINDVMIQMSPLLDKLKHIHFVYVTGEPYFDLTFEQIRSKLRSIPNHLHILPYVHNMPEVLAATSLIVNRAGASFLAEINSLGIPSILIPSPNVTNNHQEANARMLEIEGAAQVILEKELTGQILFQKIESIMGNLDVHKEMSSCSGKLGKPDSAQVVVEEMRRLVRAF